MNLEGKVALITSGGNDLGSYVASGLAAEGAKLAIFDLDPLSGEKISEKIETEYSIQPLVIKGNLDSVKGGLDIVSSVVEQFGTIDILVTSHGTVKEAPLTELTIDDFMEILNTNMRSLFLIVKAAGLVMKEKKSGSITCISPVGGWETDYSANYCAARGGIYGFIRTVAKELSKYNVQMNGVMLPVRPYTVKDIWSIFTSPFPLGCLTGSKDISSLAAFLSSDQSRIITGQIIGEPWF